MLPYSYLQNITQIQIPSLPKPKSFLIRTAVIASELVSLLPHLLPSNYSLSQEEPFTCDHATIVLLKTLQGLPIKKSKVFSINQKTLGPLSLALLLLSLLSTLHLAHFPP